MANYIGRYKRLMLLLSILFGIFSFANRFENPYISKASVTYQDKYSQDDVGHLISPLVEKISITLTKGSESRNKEAAFHVVGYNRPIALKYVLYISLWIAIGAVGVFYKIIEYIQDKDGPKRKISPNYS